MLNQRGAASVEAVFGVVLLVTIAFSIWQVALVVYARNVAAAAAHEGVRVAIERGRDPEAAATVASDVVRSTTGRLVEDLAVLVDTASERVFVRVTGRVDLIGPLPVSIAVSEDAAGLLLGDP